MIFRIFGFVLRLALILACIMAIIWAIGQLSFHNVIDLTHSWLRFCLGITNSLDRLFHVKGTPK